MIVVREIEPGKFEPIIGNPTLTSRDGEQRAPLQTILHESWSAKDRAAFGVYVVRPATIPEGKQPVGAPRYERKGRYVVEVYDLEDVPEPEPVSEPPVVDPETLQKVEQLAAAFGLTLDELRAALNSSSRST